MPSKPLPAGAMKAVAGLSKTNPASITKTSEKLQRLGKQVAKLVLIDEPLPAAMLTRYLTTVSLAGIDMSVGREQIDWVNTGLRAIRLEHELKKTESDDTAKDFSNIEKMFDGANLLNEIAAEEDDGEEEED